MSARYDVVVVGGGVAGLAAATRLAQAGVRAVVLEASPIAGGRARSWRDPLTGTTVDNGQHLLMSCYRQTLAFLERIGTKHLVAFQERLRVAFAAAQGWKGTLDCPPLPGSLSLLAGLALYRGLTAGDLVGILGVVRDVKAGAAAQEPGMRPAASDESAKDYLVRHGQSPGSLRNFWDPLIFATLNEDPRTASANTLRRVLRQALLDGPEASRLGWATVGLGDLYAPAAQAYLAARGGALSTSSPVLRVEAGRDEVTIALRDGGTLRGPAVILAASPAAVLRLVPELAGSQELRGLSAFSSSPIVGVNLWLDRPIIDEPFVGLLGTRMHWLFDRGELLSGEKESRRRPGGARAGGPRKGDDGDENLDGSRPGAETMAGSKGARSPSAPRMWSRTAGCYLSLVASGARDLVELDPSKLIEIALSDLRSVFPRARGARLLHASAVKEREATTSPAVGWDLLRPGTRTSERRVLLAGDWTATGLPATVESAALSGHLAAEACLEGP